MSDRFHPEDPTTTPTIEVSAYIDHALLRREFCETEAEAAAIVAHWEEERGVECEVRDLSATGGDPSAVEVTWENEAVDEYPIEPTA